MYATQGASGSFFNRRNLENSVSKCNSQRGVDYFYKHIKQPAPVESTKEEELPNNSFSRKLKPHERKRYGSFIPISQIVKPKHEERVSQHLKKIIAEDEIKKR